MKFNRLHIIPIVLAMVSCQVESGNVGCLVIGDVTVTQGDDIVVDTRSVDSDLVLSIKDDSGRVVHEFAAGDQAAGQKIELAAGIYSLRAYSANVNDAVADGSLGEAKYDATRTFSIQADRTSYVNLSVPMVNYAVQLVLPENFGEWFESYTFTVSAPGRSLELAGSDVAYFEYESVNTVSYSFQAKNMDNETVSSAGSFAARKGCLHQIRYELATKSFSVE